jgi:hypothetical protein
MHCIASTYIAYRPSNNQLKKSTPHLRKISRSSKASPNNPTSIIVEPARSIKVMSPTISRNVPDVVVVAKVSRRISPSADSISAVAIEASLRAKGGILLESLAVVVGRKSESEVVVAHETAGSILGLERNASAVAEACADFPTGLLLESSAA